MIGIHHVPGTFTDKWKKYCEENSIEYCLIDLFSNDLIEDIRKKRISIVLFHFNTKEYRNDLIIKDIVYLLETDGVTVFPDYNSFWHYDDKLKQKYLFETLELEHVPMQVFYDYKRTIEWIENEAQYPFVFKLKRGARSRNVQLVKNKNKARQIARKMFGRGFKVLPSLHKDNSVKNKISKTNLAFYKLLFKVPKKIKERFNQNRFLQKEKGYYLTQNFIPHLDKDFRIKVVGDACWGFIRYTRDNDFRASGSGLADYNPENIPKELISKAFTYAHKLGMRSVAFDFVYDNDAPLLLEISYCYAINDEQLTGYWTKDLKFHKGYFRPEDLIIESVININDYR